MALPVTVVFEPPTRADLGRLLASRRAWLLVLLLAGAAAAGLWRLAQPAGPDIATGETPLRVVSTPPGALIVVDGRERGRTPATVGVAPGAHELLLRRDGALDERRQLAVGPEGATISIELWRAQPQVLHLRPTFPGAVIAGADFLADGRVAMLVALPTGDERQLWLVDPSSGALERIGPPDARASMALSPDGRQFAYLTRGAGIGPAVDAERLDELWLARPGTARGARRWRLAALDERLLDLAWAPDGAHLLVIAGQRPAGGGTRSRLLWLDAAGDAAPRELVSLPSEVVAGSYGWSPDGQRLAFLARSGQLTALCVVDARGDFRYLADLSRDDPSPLPYPPVAWSSDGQRLIYAAPMEDRSGQGGWFGATRSVVALFATEPGRPLGQRLGEAEGQSPVWRRAGDLVALARPKGDGPLVLRAVDEAGAARDLGELPLRPGAAYAARWDLAHAQVLIAVRGAATFGANRPDYWLLRFGQDATP